MIKKTKPFMAVSMPCTEKQFEKELKPILEFLEVDIDKIHDLYTYKYITTNYNKIEGNIGSTLMVLSNEYRRQYHPRFCPKTFIEALGYDYEDVCMRMKDAGNRVIEQTNSMKQKINTGLTTEQFKTLADSVMKHPTHYKIKKQIPFFTAGDVIHKKTLRQYYTKKSIKKLISKNYIS